MDSTPAAGGPDPAFEQQLREMNEALLVSSVKLHELAEKAQTAEALVRVTEQELAKALVYADDIIATLREPFLVLDHDLRVKTGNRSFYDLFQVSKEETENRLVYDLGNGQWDIPALRNLLDKVLSGNQSVHDYEVDHSFPTLGRKAMLLNARPFPPDSKHPELILLAVEDISAERARTNELADLHRRKDEFLAMLSHELRSPLAPIMNAVHLLGLQKNETQLQHQARTVIQRQVKQLARLVDDLMEVSRINSGRVQLRFDRVVISGIVERAVETTRPLVAQHRHELTVSLPPQPIWLHGDAARLEQVVVNLLTNAAKYTDEGGQIWLTVELETDKVTRWQGDKVTESKNQPSPGHLVPSSPCQLVTIRVRDTGVGIAPEFLPRIFDLFTQAERSLDRSQGGLGIGLALVQRLVEMHQGTVEVFSVLGQGSEFVVRLPLKVESRETSDESKETSDSSLSSLDSRLSTPLKILVVDDNVDTAQTMAILLKESGHDVCMAHDGPTALEAAHAFRPNVVLLDIGLPGLDGYEVAKRLRQQSALPNVVLVAITGYGQDTDRQRSQEAGFDHHLVKPVDIGKVQQILAAVSEKAT